MYCIPSLYNHGGMEKILTEKVNYLINDNDFEITVLTNENINKSLAFELDTRINLMNFNFNYEEHYNKNILMKFFIYKKLIKNHKRTLETFINDNKFDIVISLGGKELEFIDQLNICANIIVELHFSKNYRIHYLNSINKNNFLWNFYGRIRTIQLVKKIRKIDKLVVLTKSDLQDWQRELTNVIQIPNFITRINKTPALLFSPNIITIGRLDHQKGYDLLIEVWRLVALKHPEWKLNIYGSGNQENELKNLVLKYNLENSIIFHGKTNNASEEYLLNSIYVMSSRFEGFPLVLLEAMSFGLPVISFDCEHGPSEIIRDYYNGFLITNFNFKNFAEKISMLINNYELRKSLGTNAYLTSLKFDKEHIMSIWKNTFQEIKKQKNEKQFKKTT